MRASLATGAQHGPFDPASERSPMSFTPAHFRDQGPSPRKGFPVPVQGPHTRAMNTVCRSPNTSFVRPRLNRYARPGVVLPALGLGQAAGNPG